MILIFKKKKKHYFNIGILIKERFSRQMILITEINLSTYYI